MNDYETLECGDCGVEFENEPGEPHQIQDGLCNACTRPRLLEEIKRLNVWVSDLQSGMYVNCVYCGHRYGPGETTPVSMADALKAHVEGCPKHPMSALKAELGRRAERIAELETLIVGVRELDALMRHILKDHGCDQGPVLESLISKATALRAEQVRG